LQTTFVNTSRRLTMAKKTVNKSKVYTEGWIEQTLETARKTVQNWPEQKKRASGLHYKNSTDSAVSCPPKKQ